MSWVMTGGKNKEGERERPSRGFYQWSKVKAVALGPLGPRGLSGVFNKGIAQSGDRDARAFCLPRMGFLLFCCFLARCLVIDNCDKLVR